MLGGEGEYDSVDSDVVEQLQKSEATDDHQLL